ncbi:MAG: hypothetical protein ACR2PB_00360 [Desulfocapsaceae bacterium]
MMDLTWYILGTLTGAIIYGMYLLSSKYIISNWWNLAGIGAGAGLVLFSIAWGVGAVLEGVPRAGSMGLLLFGLPGIIILSFLLRRILSHKEIF